MPCRPRPLVLMLPMMILARGVSVSAEVGPAGEVARLKGHAATVMTAAFSPDGAAVISGAMDGTGILWDVATAKASRRLVGHDRGLTSVAFSGDGARAITGSLDHTARVWDARSGELLALLAGKHTEHVHAAALSPDGRKAITGSCDRTAILWDVATERPIRIYPLAGEVHAVAFSPDGKTFLTGHNDATNGAARGAPARNLIVYDAGTAAEMRSFEVPPVDQAFFIDGGRRALLRCDDELWVADLGARTAARLPKVGGPTGYAHVAPSGDGRAVLAATIAGDVAYREVATARPLLEFPPQREAVWALAVSPDGRRGLYGGGGDLTSPWGAGAPKARDPDLKLVSLDGPGRADARFSLPDAPFGRPVMFLAVTLDGTRMLSTDGTGPAVWWDTASGRAAGHLNIGNAIGALAISPDGSRIAVAQGTRAAAIYDGHEGTAPLRIEHLPHAGISLAFAPDGKGLAIATGPDLGESPNHVKNDVGIWDLATQAELRRFDGTPSGVRKVAFSPDGRLLLAAGSAGGVGRVQAWDVATGKPLWSFAGEKSKETVTIAALVVSGDARRAAVCMDHLVYILDASTGRASLTLDRHVGTCLQVAFDPDGARVWTVARGDAVRCWDARSGHVTRTLELALRQATTTAFVFRDGHRTLFDGAWKAAREYDLGD